MVKTGKYEEKTAAKRIDLRLELSTIKKDSNETIVTRQFRRNQLTDCRAAIKNEKCMRIMLNGLPRNYNIVRLQMKTNGLENINVDEFRASLKEKEEELELDETEEKL